MGVSSVSICRIEKKKRKENYQYREHRLLTKKGIVLQTEPSYIRFVEINNDVINL